ncbi:DNA polymerase Y family protein [Ramlibacter sp.]|uniref:Y-family DNA polymerase n=1 Tax=Ramlibacter sp. TaxID=1917967 RepID=UPI002C1BB76C|nr:DNA polymerase Y family protein [Ramlibacter sp.]HWI83389.1 DNA polymerase Y family protein [Ramlibacter sp.]
MYWIALQPSNDQERAAWGWRCLQFTPRVALVDEALLLEASASLRLWGGRRQLLRLLIEQAPPLAAAAWAEARTSLQALAQLRMHTSGRPGPRLAADELPLHLLTAAREHVGTLERIGCRTWGDARRLPRPGVARRFGAALVEALDRAYGERPESYPWLELPASFDLKVELPALASDAPALMWTAQRLLSQLQVWLQARNQAVLAFEIEWTLDLRRLDGVQLPSHQQLVVRTGQPTQDVAHLRRLLGEHLARASLAAPANHLRLRSIETVPWAGGSKSLLPQDNVTGEALHQLIERLSVRLGAGNVVVARQHADHRPEHMQTWCPANAASSAGANRKAPLPCDALYPAWLLPQPRRLEVRGEKPQYQGPLRLLAGPQRLETGWWDGGAPGPAVRDYFIARSDHAGLLWIYRERLPQVQEHGETVRWYLHGVYA